MQRTAYIGRTMHQSHEDLVRKLYQSRDAGDEAGIRACLSDGVLWHEPDLGTEHTGDLRGPDAVLAMISRAQQLTGGTFRLHPREVVANGEHAVALVDWSATREGSRLEGKEVAVYRIRDGEIVEVSFHQDDPNLDQRFWESGS